MTDQEKQILNPTEWNKVTNYVIELSQQMTKAMSASSQQRESSNCAPSDHRSVDCGIRSA